MASVAVWQIRREEMRFPLNPASHDHRFAEICLRVASRVRQRHEHLASAPLVWCRTRIASLRGRPNGFGARTGFSRRRGTF